MLSFVLLSRRERYRVGRRYVCRGADANGHVANFAETEQVLYVQNVGPITASTPSAFSDGSAYVFSFLQTRGSIPLLWTQPLSGKYSPKITLLATPDATTGTVSSPATLSSPPVSAASDAAFRLHFDSTLAHYGRQICVSLVNSKSGEGMVTNAYQQQCQRHTNASSPVAAKWQSFGGLRYIHFDFHRECKNMKYENINRLVESLRDEFKSQQYFSARLTPSDASPWRCEILSKQSGVFRTNCIDCLDRTNVVQSVFAHRVLEAQLLSLGRFFFGGFFPPQRSHSSHLRFPSPRFFSLVPRPPHPS